MMKCMGCDVASGALEPPGGMLFETKSFVVHQDPSVPMAGFIVIASKEHVRSVAELDEQAARELFALVYRVRQALGAGEYSLIQEERSAHLHIWLFPRQQWAEAWFANSLDSVRSTMRYASEHMRGAEHESAMLSEAERIKNILNEPRFNKLVRDRIPEIVDASGRTAITARVQGGEYLQRLNTKLFEEVLEYLDSGDVEELADIYEVIKAILAHKGVAPQEFETVAADKRQRNGGFDAGIVLKEIKD